MTHEAPEPEVNDEKGNAPRSPLDPFRGETDDWMKWVIAGQERAEPGRLGSYLVLDTIVSGGQSVVYRARHDETGREVALKRVAAFTFSTESSRRRFEREAELLLGFRHPNIVTVYGIERIDDVPVIVMEWVKGESIADWSRRVDGDPDRMQRRVRVFLEVCEAIEHAHAQGVLHRDLKPSNILIGDDARPRVLDFGLARRLELDVVEGVAATRTLGYVGTPSYTAPERFTDDRSPLDVRSDVFSLGVVLYEMLAGRRPFEGSSLPAVVESVRLTEPPRLSAIDAAIPRDLDLVVRKALAKAPEHRYQTVHALADDLRRFLSGRPVLAVAPSMGYVLQKLAQRNRLAATLACAIVILGVASVGFGVRQYRALARERNASIEASERATRLARESMAKSDFYVAAIFSAATPYGGAGSGDILDVVEKALSNVALYFEPDSPLALETTLQLCRIFVLRDDFDRADEIVASAAAIESRLAVPHLEHSAQLDQLRGAIFEGRRRFPEAIESFRRAIAKLDSCEPTESVTQLRMGILAELAPCERKEFDLPAAEAHLRESIAYLRSRPDAELIAVDLESSLGWVLLDLGRHDDAIELAKRGLDSLDRSVPAFEVVAMKLLWMLGEAYSRNNDVTRALATQREAHEIASRVYPATHGDRRMGEVALATALLAAGELEASQTHFAALSEALVNHPQSRVSSRLGEMHALVRLGHHDEARAIWEESKDLIRTTPVRVVRVLLSMRAIEALSELGEVDSTRNLVRELLDFERAANTRSPMIPPHHRATLRAVAAKHGFSDEIAADLSALDSRG